MFFSKLPVLCGIVFICLMPACESPAVNPPPPPPDNSARITLSLAETPDLRELRIAVLLENAEPPLDIELLRDSTPVFNGTLAGLDTSILDTGLFPATAYTYRGYLLKEGTRTDSSETFITATMDTTSHEFTWQTWTIGSGGNSVLRDVFIIDENDIWAVGEITIEDSTGDREDYNALHWDGEVWEPLQVPTRISFGTIDHADIYAVWAFSTEDIWMFSVAGSYSHWDGNSWETEFVYEAQGTVKAMWGTSSNNLFFAGTNGSITHFDGQEWQLMESNTEINLTDVWGSPDGSVVWACGWEDFQPTILLEWRGSAWVVLYEDIDNLFEVFSDTLSGILGSGWSFDNNSTYVASSSGVYRIPQQPVAEIQRSSFTDTWFPGFPFRIRGNNINDFFIGGEFFLLAHYNGWSWKIYDFFGSNGRFQSVAQNGQTVCAAGFFFASPGVFLAMGTR